MTTKANVAYGDRARRTPSDGWTGEQRKSITDQRESMLSLLRATVAAVPITVYAAYADFPYHQVHDSLEETSDE